MIIKHASQMEFHPVTYTGILDYQSPWFGGEYLRAWFRLRKVSS